MSAFTESLVGGIFVGLIIVIWGAPGQRTAQAH
jgi:hypothetical protein